MSHAAKVKVRELTPELLDDYLRFFDKDAFTDFQNGPSATADSTMNPGITGMPPPKPGLHIERHVPNESDQAKPTAC